jgi:fatty acid desaturase
MFVCLLLIIKSYMWSTVRSNAFLLLATLAPLALQASILGSFFLAVFGWLMGALGHDAGHFAASRIPAINDAAVWAMSLLCNPILWQHQHTYAHHSHTNSFEHDPDLHHFTTFLRVHRKFQQGGTYQNQSNRFFVAFAYMFVVFGTCIWIPFNVIREGSLYGMVEWTDRSRPFRTFGMYLHLLLYTAFIVVLPFFVHAHWYSALGAVYAHVATSGLIFAIFSQINHLNEASLDNDWFERRSKQRNNPSLDKSWAVRQIETSNNFCPESRLWHILSNGLNLQIEHHLFPGLNHCHLCRIQPTVQAVCEEYGVCYKNFATWSDLMSATLQWLDRLSVEPPIPEVASDLIEKTATSNFGSVDLFCTK